MSDELSSDLASLRIDRDATAPRRRWPRVVLVVAVLAAAGAAAIRFGLPYLESSVFKTEIAVTEITLVSPAQSQVELTATGYVVPQTVSKVGAKIPGRVAQVAVKEGDVVQQGQLLARLEDADKRSAIAAARALVASARAKVHTARANLLETQQKARRQRALKARGLATPATVEDLDARVASLRATVKAAEAEVAAARTQAKTLDVERGYLTINAPIAGTVVTKPVEVGELVGPDAPILELADMASNVIEVDVPETRLHLIKTGGPCEALLDAYPGKRLRGEVLSVSPKVNRAKATVTVKVKLVDSSERVLPEMAARVSFLRQALDAEAIKAPPKLVVPQSAIVERGGAKVVFVVDGEKVRMRPVTLGPPFGGGFELLRGPSAGTRLVSGPPATLTDGQKVKEKDAK